MRVFLGLLRELERWLRIDRDGPPGDVTRARAIYTVALTMVGLQIVNQAGMWWTYGGWTYDQTLSAVGSAVLLVGVAGLRWFKSFRGYAVLYGLLSFSIFAGSALPDHLGIHSSLVPFICIGPMVVGYISGWRAALVYWALASLFLLGLYRVSVIHPEVPLSDARLVARFIQAELALFLSAVLAVNFSTNTYNALARQQEGLERARRAEAAKSEFLATMSHELRTPLNGVIGMAEALAARDLGEEEQKMADTIRRSGESLLVIIGDLLDLSKIEAGKLEIEERAFSPADLVRHIADNWQDAAAAKGITLETRIAPDVPDALMGDDHRIGQILQNLISNAVKFTEGGRVELSLHAQRYTDGQAVTFRVRDTGRGVPEDVRDRIFEPFEQGERGMARSFGGTGLGLPICRLLTELMEGSIALESTGPEGTVFAVHLRLREAKVSQEARIEPRFAPSTFEGLRVLVAEDNHINQLVMREFLKAWGAEMVFADDGHSCLEALQADRFDILLLDKHMPGMSGLDVAVRIRKTDARYRNIPIIGVSADTMEGEREDALAAGMDAYVPKPVKPDVLRRAMEAALSDGSGEVSPARRVLA